jgi:spermidine synthase
MKKYSLEIIVFISGAMIMILELVGSRVVAPYVGTSTFVWTSLIGVILASLSLGYYLGGKVADRNPKAEKLAWIIFIASALIVLTWIIKDQVMLMSSIISDNRLRALFSATVLFVPASLFLGMVSPYAFKLKLSNLDTSGQTAGTLYALSTLGSIIGTFLAGFYLIPSLGTQKLLILIALALALNTLLIKEGKTWYLRALYSLILFVLLFFNFNTVDVQAKNFIDLDTKYSRVWIYDTEYKGKETRVLLRDDKFHSAKYLNSDELVFDYTKYYNLALNLLAQSEETLMLGGAAYSYPQYLLKNYPSLGVDVVEIDPQLTALAREHFGLKDHDNLNIYHDDARIYIDNNKKDYDIIYGDAFSSHYSVPHHLTTLEFNNNIYDSLKEEGVYIMNIISSIDGPKSDYFKAQYFTTASVFDEVLVFPVVDKDNEQLVQNIILLAYKGEKTRDELITNLEDTKYLDSLYMVDDNDFKMILTDDYAPVEYFIGKIK